MMKEENVRLGSNFSTHLSAHFYLASAPCKCFPLSISPSAVVPRLIFILHAIPVVAPHDSFCYQNKLKCKEIDECSNE